MEKIRRSRVAEIGVGSGFVIGGYVNTQRPDFAVGTDVDLEALRRAWRRDDGMMVEYVLCQSSEAFRDKSFELVFSNPPYLRSEGDVDLATAGGKEGIERTVEIATSSKRVLSEGGILVFLASSLSSRRRLLNRLKAEGIDVKRIGSLKLFFEELTAYRATVTSRRLR